jgi:hypothetical protein
MRKTIFSLILIAAGVCGFGQALKPVAAANPSVAGSIQPNWAVGADGSLLLSWVEPAKNDTYTLRYAARKGGAWSEARTIATGRSFWRHPSEVPELVALADGTLLAHWVEKGKGEAEYVFVSSSKDGVKWSAPAMAHKDKSEEQHGLASAVASGPAEMSILWLQALKGEDGPVSLMRTVVGADGKEIKEEEVDKDVCACCPTSVVKTAKGFLVAYRGHTSKDIRDINIVRYEGGKWSASKNLNPDKWEINACPVNSAAAAAKDNRVAVSWYTEADDKPRVQLAFSSDAGATFTKAIVVSTKDTLGYASTALSADGGAYVSWIEEGEKSSRAIVRLVSAAGVAGPPIAVGEGSRANLGYPKLAQAGGETWIAWGDPRTGIKTAQLK